MPVQMTLLLLSNSRNTVDTTPAILGGGCFMSDANPANVIVLFLNCVLQGI